MDSFLKVLNTFADNPILLFASIFVLVVFKKPLIFLLKNVIPLAVQKKFNLNIQPMIKTTLENINGNEFCFIVKKKMIFSEMSYVNNLESYKAFFLDQFEEQRKVREDLEIDFSKVKFINKDFIPIWKVLIMNVVLKNKIQVSFFFSKDHNNPLNELKMFLKHEIKPSKNYKGNININE